jgi:outer membrane protein assembly factor BamB
MPVRAAVLAGCALLAIAFLVSGATQRPPATQRSQVALGPHRRTPDRSRTLPLSLLGAASTALGPSSRLRAIRVGGAVRTTGDGISGTFSVKGVSLKTAGGSLQLAPAVWGRSATLARTGVSAPAPSADSVVYDGRSITESFRNSAYGVEQSFSVHAPPRNAHGPLTIAVRLSGSLTPRAERRELRFQNARGEPVLRYGDLRATDATGRRLPASMRLEGRTLELQVDDAGARYPLTVDPFISQAKLSGSGIYSFGRDLALDAAGDTAAVGAPDDSEKKDGGEGEVLIFTRSGSSWKEQATLTPATPAYDQGFGSTVALSADGDTMLVGDETTGRAWVFTRTGSSWSQQTAEPLEDTRGPNSGERRGNFAASVALSADGNTALIGAPWMSEGAKEERQEGTAWLFARSGSTWSRQAVLKGTQQTLESRFGESVALSGEGTTAVIGAPGQDEDVGAAWVFEGSGSAWTQRGSKLEPEDETSEGEFGDSVTLSTNGETTLIGADDDDFGAGGAWAFVRTPTGFAQQGPELLARGEPASGGMGAAVALSGDGNTALISGPWSEGNGAAWRFEREDGNWSDQEKLSDPEGPSERPDGEDGFAAAIALSSDGATSLISAAPDYTWTSIWTYTGSWSTPEPQPHPIYTPSSEEQWSNIGGGASHSGTVISAALEPPSATLWSQTFPPAEGVEAWRWEAGEWVGEGSEQHYVEPTRVPIAPQQMLSEPLLGDGLIFVVQRDNGSPEHLELDAYDEQTGKRVWSYESNESAIYMALDGERLFTDGIGKGIVALQAATGKVLWTRPEPSSRPIPLTASEGVLYFTDDTVGATLYAVSEASGRTLWRESYFVESGGFTLAGGGRVYVMGGPGNGVGASGTAFNAATGEGLWAGSSEYGSYAGCSWSSQLSEGHLLDAPCGVEGTENPEGVVVNAETGASEGRYMSGPQNMPVLDGEDVIGLVEQFNDGLHEWTLKSPATLTAQNYKTGQTLWSFDGDGKLDSGVVRINNNVYVGSESGELYAVDAQTGKEVWSMKMPTGFTPEETYEEFKTGIATDGKSLAVVAGNSLTVLKSASEVPPAGSPSASSSTPPSTPKPPQPGPSAGVLAVRSAQPPAAKARCTQQGRPRLEHPRGRPARVRVRLHCSSPTVVKVSIGYLRAPRRTARHTQAPVFVALVVRALALRSTDAQLTISLPRRAQAALSSQGPDAISVRISP